MHATLLGSRNTSPPHEASYYESIDAYSVPLSHSPASMADGAKGGVFKFMTSSEHSCVYTRFDTLSLSKAPIMGYGEKLPNFPV